MVTLVAIFLGDTVLSLIGGADFVSRDEFEAVKAVAATAREEVETLKARVAALEAKG